MDLSAFERDINTIERSLDALTFWLAFWTFLVVTGLVVEYWPDVRDLLTTKPFNWKLFQTIVGGILITAGVTGEFVIQFKASKIENDLRVANHKVVALLNDQAARAGRDAESAKRTAREFESKISDSGARVKTAEAQVALANAASKAAVARVATADARIAEANLKRVELESKMLDVFAHEPWMKRESVVS